MKTGNFESTIRSDVWWSGWHSLKGYHTSRSVVNDLDGSILEKANPALGFFKSDIYCMNLTARQGAHWLRSA